MDILVVSAISGIVAGSLHALSGPDHVAALSPLALSGLGKPDRRAWLLGLRWGLGHGAGILLLGFLALGLRGMVPAELLSGWGERAVGASLILVGLWGLRRAFSSRVHVHEHEHDGRLHAHVHAHGIPSPIRGEGREGSGPVHRHSHAPLGLGLLHGFAGGSHLVFLIPALALPGFLGASLYLGGFILGAASAMALLTQVLAWTGAGLGQRQTWLLGGASLMTLAVGGFWLVS